MYTYVTDIKGVSKFQKEYQKVSILGMDTETTGLDPITDKVLLIQVKAGNATFIFDRKRLGDLTKYVIQLIKDSGKLCIFHNAKFDLKFIYSNFGEMLTNVYDTQLGEMLICNGLNTGKDLYPSLASLTSKYLSVDMSKEVRSSFIRPKEVSIQEWYDNFSPTEEQILYSALDVEYLESIMLLQKVKLEEQKQDRVIDLENELVPVVASMELNGIKLNVARWKELIVIAEEEYKILDARMMEMLKERLAKKLKKCNTLQEMLDLLSVPYKKTKKNLAIITQPVKYEFVAEQIWNTFNIGSTKQLLSALNLAGFTKLTSTGEDALNELDSDDELLDVIKETRSKGKLISSFGKNFLAVVHPVTGKLHTQFNQLGARSGRFSSGGSDESKNLQNIVADKEYRMCFIADPGYKIVGADFSQEEYRLAGAISKEPVIIEAYRIGKDMHVTTASMVFEVAMENVTKQLRNEAKPINFGIIYGISAFGMHKKMKIPKEKAEWIISTFFKGYPNLAKFQSEYQNWVVKNKYSTTLIGRKRYFEIPSVWVDHKQMNKVLGMVRREGFNHIIQGTGADIVKLALCRLYYENPFGIDNFKILLTVHDEIQCMVKEEYAKDAKVFIVKIMQEVEQIFLGDIPAVAEAEVADYWAH